jgi:ribose 5-phosphate isomerase
VSAGLQEETNWIPRSFQEAARNLAEEAVESFVKPSHTIGLGTGPMAAAIVREMANFDGKEESLESIPTSFQIKLEAKCSRG